MYAIGLLIINYQFIFVKLKTKCILSSKNKNLPELDITYDTNTTKLAFTNCVHSYDRARNVHANSVTCAQKFVHGID